MSEMSKEEILARITKIEENLAREGVELENYRQRVNEMHERNVRQSEEIEEKNTTIRVHEFEIQLQQRQIKKLKSQIKKLKKNKSQNQINSM